MKQTQALQYFACSEDLPILFVWAKWACKIIFILWIATVSFQPLPSSNYLDVSEVFKTWGFS